MSGSSKKSSGPPVTYEVGDIVLAKIKGYPPWPARIVDPDVTPAAVQKERPKGAKNTFYCVRFYPAGDHAWQVAKDMSKLLKHEIEAYIREPSKKNGDLMDAYKTALDPTEWEARLERLQQELEEEERNAPVDELEDEDEDEDEEDAKPLNRKRKRVDDSGKRSKAKTTRAKREPKAKSEEAAPRSRKGRSRKNGALSAAEVVESEDEAAGETKGDTIRQMKRPRKEEEEDGDEALTPEGTRVKQWRHELQRSFLPKSGNPKAEDMKQSSDLMTTLEEYTPQLTLDLMTKSKIGKVMRRVAGLHDGVIPNNDEYNIRERAQKLVTEWSKIAADGANAASAAPATTTNGDAMMADASADADAHAEPDPTNGDVLKEDEPKTTPAVHAAATEQVPAMEPEVTTADSVEQAPTNTDAEMEVASTNA